MSWFKVDDHLHAHKKTAKAGTEAMGLWVLAGSWSGAEESDGWVPAYMLPRLGGTDDLAQQLVHAGYWHMDVVDGEDGYRFHDWAEYQPTKAQLEQKRADARERMRRNRDKGGDVRANSERTSRAVTPTPTRPDPTPNNTTPAGADFDTWWDLYPHKVGKVAAEKSYAKALKTVGAEVLLDGLRNAVQCWTASGTERRFIPHPSTWLNRGSWADEVVLPGMPDRSAEPMRRANFCGSPDCNERHPWEDGANHYMCLGA